MKISGVRIRTKKKGCYRNRQWAQLISLKTIDDDNAFKCLYPDGEIVHIQVNNNDSYEISRGREI